MPSNWEPNKLEEATAQPEKAALLEIKHVTRRYPEHGGRGTLTVFQDVSFEIEKGEFVTMVGHSGCGKSTILNIIAGLDTASEGYVNLENKRIRKAGLDRMVVFQNFALIPWMTAYENVRLAVKSAYPQWSKEQTRAHIEKYLTITGLSHSAQKRPAALSGGMRQRVGLARAFAVGPKVLLLDEPFAQIDALTRGKIQDELVQMWSETQNTVFMVTHDVDEAILLSDKIILMTNGPRARIAEIVEVAIPRPRSRETIVQHPLYAKIRSHLLHFLVERSYQLQKEEWEPTDAPPALVQIS